MKAVLKKISQAILLVPAMVLALSGLAPIAAHAVASPGGGTTGGTTTGTSTCDNLDVGSVGIGGGAECAQPTNAHDPLFGTNGVFVTIVNILIFIVGAIAVLMLIIGGIRYVVSNGEQSSVTSAKNTILYAIIGIIVAFLAYGAVNFVVGQLQK